jgi:hypothetical protein
MPDHEVQKVDLPERVSLVSPLFRRSDAMRKLGRECPHRLRIRRVVVASNGQFSSIEQKCCKQIPHARFNRAGVGLAQSRLEGNAPSLLARRHTSLSPQRTIGVIQEIAGGDIDRDIVVEGEVLTPFEGLESVDGDLAEFLNPAEFSSLNEETVTPQSRHLVGNRRVTT